MASLKREGLQGTPDFVDGNIKDRYACPACKHVLRSPMQTECGHRVCEPCVSNLLDQHLESPRCPMGGEDCVILSRNTVIPDYAGRKDLEKLMVHCMFKNYGCDHVTSWTKLEDHLKRCPHSFTPCPQGCGTNVLRNQLDAHSDICPVKQDCCQFQYCGCLFKGNLVEIRSHLEENRDRHLNLLVQYTDHLKFENDELEGRLNEENNRCKERVAHIKQPQALEQNRTMMSGVKVHEEKSNSEDDQKTGIKQLDTLSLENVQLRNEISAMERLLKTTQEENNRCKEHVDHIKQPQAHEQNRTLMSGGKVHEEKSNLEDDQKMGIKQLDTLSLENVQLRNEISAMERHLKTTQKLLAKCMECVSKLEAAGRSYVKRDSVAALTRRINSIEDSQQELKRNMPTREQRSRNMDNIISMQRSGLFDGLLDNELNYHPLPSHPPGTGTDLTLRLLDTSNINSYTWTLNNFAQRLADAKSGRAVSILSPSFYSSSQGYKMCSRVYLNGTGVKRGTHVSLFIAIMKGDYDDCLPWPFSQRVSLVLLDQTGSQHLVDVVRPDPGSSSFQKPQGEMNIPYGSPAFVSHAELEAGEPSYVVEDAIVIKIVMDMQM